METIDRKLYILITGGSGGIGSALCKLLAASNIKPIVGFNKNEKEANNLAKEFGGFSLKIDMTSDASIDKAIQYISEHIDESDELMGVVLGASPPPDIFPFQQISSEHLSHQFRVNVIGTQFLLKRLIKKFFRKKKIGIVIGVLTQAIGSEERPPATGMGAYVVAKAALNSMLSVCAAEYTWLKVETVTPGFTKTKMLDVFDPRYLSMLEEKNKIASPEEVAQSILEKVLS